MKTILKAKTKVISQNKVLSTLVLVLLMIPTSQVFGYSYYTPSSSSSSYSPSSSGSSYSYYTPSSSNSSSYSYYTPSSSNSSSYSYYTPSSSRNSSYSYYTPSYNYGSRGNSSYSYYTPSNNYSSSLSNYTDSYLPSYGCSGSRCSGSTAGTYRYGSNSGGYNYGSTGGYNYLPSGGSSVGGMLGGALGINYSDNDTTITDNSDNSVRIRNNIRNSSTTINTTNTCSNGNNASSSGNCNTVNNYIATNDDDDNDDDLEVICRVSDTSIDEGDTVKFTVEIDGGRPSYRIEWDGDISGDDDEERVRFNRSGTYRVSVEVRDANGDRASDDCAVVRVGDDEDEDDDDDDRRITVTTGSNLNTPNGNLAGLESVFLSQVPYTGPTDVLKVLGILALIAVWSTAVAMYFKKQRALNSVSNKIANFKEQNKSANKIA